MNIFLAAAAAVLFAQQSTTGESLFFGKADCAQCHEVNGRGGVTGPDLSAAGTRSSEALREKILKPGGGPPAVIVKLQDGREIRGVRLNEDTFSLQMRDASGQLHLLDKAKLGEVRYENRSLMPDDYEARLTAEELQNLVAYLASLKGRDPD